MQIVSQAMMTNHPSTVGPTYVESEIGAVSLCEGDSAALEQLKCSRNDFVRPPASLGAAGSPSLGHAQEKKESHWSDDAVLNSMWATDISKLSLQPGETLASDMPRCNSHTLASVRIGWSAASPGVKK